MDRTDNKNIINEKQLKEDEEITAITRKTENNNKKINQIEKSNTWRLSNIPQYFREVLSAIFNQRQSKEEKVLLEQLYEKEKKINLLKTQLNEQALSSKTLSKREIELFAQQLKKDGLLLGKINKLINKQVEEEVNTHYFLNYSARLLQKEEKVMDYLYPKFISNIPLAHLTDFIVRQGIDEEMSLQDISSYRVMMHLRIRKLQLQNSLPEWRLDDKKTAYEFMKALNIPIPDYDNNVYNLERIPIKAGTVIKPKDGAGGRGVYLVHDLDNIINIKQSSQITRKEQLIDSMKNDLKSGFVDDDQWTIETLIYENKNKKTPARDIKFYMFYGKVGLILEIKRYPEMRHCWWTRHGKKINCGKYNETLFTGEGVTEHDIKQAEEISLEIPSPFIRIDFLKTEQGLVFGEFTPKPGNYDEFDSETDKKLGDLYLSAEENIINDLMKGKTFKKYKDFFDFQ